MAHLGSLESTQEAQFLVLSKLIACIIITQYTLAEVLTNFNRLADVLLFFDGKERR